MIELSVLNDDLIVKNVRNTFIEGLSVLKHAKGSSKKVVIDCTQVKKIDSTGLAVLCAWWQYASGDGISCHFECNDLVQEVIDQNKIELP
ncbi:STAS domain-containing protein [Candidatus Comchoanobacter bicostacola]|uniref:STAS domain-containing protein n=1 Tax=Candidatus Comchoanobacter bicostacola TaxID=2919598 RepID=A0ABY5DJE9_9GAMM|nr:STAS domain-containing protein [Candidatus Comchoanobacter bicostacola]UTC24449.1 STAS domain-containing protein [Candidatus Comchoanobacter bicostacola]